MLKGDEVAFREFVDLYKARLFSSILGHVGCRHEAEEIVQESFIKAFQYLPSFQHQSQIYTWIYRIAWNTSASRARKNRNDVSLEISGAEATTSAPESFEPHIPMERRERIALLREGLGDIESRHRKILLLREFDGLSYQEIAEVMSIPLGTVRSRLARARDRLREQLITIEEQHDGGSRRTQAAKGLELVVGSFCGR
jgi:RNA polymerase sigma-70 factor (ECF subfamily)